YRFDSLLDRLAVLAFSRNVAGREEGHDGQPSDGRILPATRPPGAVVILRAVQEFQSPVDAVVERRPLRALVGFSRVDHADENCERRANRSHQPLPYFGFVSAISSKYSLMIRE